jgi:argininosuccinate lyase
MTKLWNKSNAKKTHPLVEQYTAGTDYLFDTELFLYDIEASIAHARGLKKIGIITATELSKLERTFRSLRRACIAGEVAITPQDEDCHTVIENYLVEKLGDVGKKIHTGRSRNDQVLVALRLYMKDHVARVRKQCLDLAEEFVKRADVLKRTPMPGYSHTQQAMLTSVGHYLASFAESLLDDEALLGAVSEHLDTNPLGAAAGFGTAIPLDRAYTTRELGFARPQINSLYSQTSRGKFESVVLEGLGQVMATLGRFANDMLLFTSQEFAYFEAADAIVTGSSIMPHKRNLDPLEILRGNVGVVTGNHVMVKEISKNLLSGYNRDLQLLKKPLIESMRIVHDSLAIVALALEHLTPNESAIRAKLHRGMFTADIANDMVLTKGIPFRDAYQMAASSVKKQADLAQNLASKKSIGAPGNLSLATYRERIKKQRAQLRAMK